MSSEDPTRATMKIPMSSPDITDAEREAVANVLDTTRLSIGPELGAFEVAVAAEAGVAHGIGVSSGTTGLHLCVRAAEVSEGDWVITTPFSFVASVNVLLYERAIPVFVDVEPLTGNLDPEQVAQAAADLTSGIGGWGPRESAESSGRLKAVLAVDVFGQPADYDPVEGVAEEHGLTVIEDSSESLGARYKRRRAGSFGDAAVFAFYPNKQVTTGEGGMVVTNRDDWARLMRALRNQGRAEGDTWLQHSVPGYNYRLDEMSAALGRVQMDRLEELLDKRAAVAVWYAEALGGVDGLELPQVAPTTTRMSWFVYVVRLDAAIDRARVIERLATEGIPARGYFEPIHLQPFMVERYGFREGDFPVTEDIGRRSLALPFSGIMTREQVESVAGALKTAID